MPATSRRSSRAVEPGAGDARPRPAALTTVVLPDARRAGLQARGGRLPGPLDDALRPPEPAVAEGDTTGDWLRMFGVGILADVPPDDLVPFLADVDRLTAPDLRGADGSWHADYVRLRWVATSGPVGRRP